MNTSHITKEIKEHVRISDKIIKLKRKVKIVSDIKKTTCSGCGGEFDSEDMIIQDVNTIYCASCDHENQAKQDAKTDDE